MIFFIQVINNGGGIVNSWGSKYIDSVMLTHSLKEIVAVRSDIELELVSLDFECDICFFIGEDRVDESFIEV